MRFYLSTGLLALLPTIVLAQEVPPSCPAANGTEKTEDLQALPVPVAHSLQRHVPNLSAPGSAFNGGDALSLGQTMPDRRLVAAFHRSNRWVIAYEAAGRAYNVVVVAYEISEDGKTSTIAFKTQTAPQTLCNAVDEALSSDGPVDRYW